MFWKNSKNVWESADKIPLKIVGGRKEGFRGFAVKSNYQPGPWKIQLETAMGAAIECFQGAGAIEVSRIRFAPVKTTSDLLAVRSDAYELTEDFCLRLHPSQTVPPGQLIAL